MGGHVSSQQESVLLAEGTGALARREQEGSTGVTAVSILRAWGSWPAPVRTMAAALPGCGSLLGPQSLPLGSSLPGPTL